MSAKYLRLISWKGMVSGYWFQVSSLLTIAPRTPTPKACPPTCPPKLLRRRRKRLAQVGQCADFSQANHLLCLKAKYEGSTFLSIPLSTCLNTRLVTNILYYPAYFLVILLPRVFYAHLSCF